MFFRPSVRAFVTLALANAMLAPLSLRAANWLPFGPDGGDARRIEADPSDHTHLYLGTVNGWVYESRDTGASWRRLSRVAKRDDLVLDHILVDPHDPKHVVVGAFALDHPDGGLFVSYDSGRTWTSQAEMRGQSIRSLAESAADPNIFVAGTLKGVFRSDDGGRRWRQISPADSTEIHEVESVAIDPKDPNVIYAGTWHLPWKTTDGGEHWNNIKEGIIEDSDVFSIIVDPDSPNTVYASACSGIYKSEDAGELFHKVQGIPSTARRTRVLLQDPNNLAVVFAGTTEGLWRSEDSGKTWSRLTGPEVIVNDVSVDKADSKKVLIATDRGGVLASDDGGTSFHPSNSGFSTRQITAIKKDMNHPARLLVGVVNDKEWGGVFESGNGGLNWQQVSGGLGGRDVFSLGQAPDGTMIAGTSHGLFRLDAALATWVRADGVPEASVTATPEPVRPAVVAARAPVPVGRNLYVRSGAARLPKNATPAQKKAALRSASKPGSPAKAKHTAGVVRVQVSAHKRTQSAKAGKTKPTSHAHPVPGARSAAKSSSMQLATSPSMPATAPTGTADARREQGVVEAGAASAALGQSAAPAPAARGGGFDGSVYALATAGQQVLAATSVGLLSSSDDGVTWTLTGPENSDSWRFLAAAKKNVVAASLHSAAFSADAGASWSPVLMPEGLSQIGAAAVSPAGEIWIGGREGVFVSSNGGSSWTTPKNLFVNSVNSIFYDDSANRMMVTTGGYSNIVFLVQLPTKQVTFADTGWNLRFARPVGDHLIAATLFDGIVIQPRMVASPMQPSPAQRTPQEAPVREAKEVPSAP